MNMCSLQRNQVMHDGSAMTGNRAATARHALASSRLTAAGLSFCSPRRFVYVSLYALSQYLKEPFHSSKVFHRLSNMYSSKGKDIILEPFGISTTVKIP